MASAYLEKIKELRKLSEDGLLLSEIEKNYKDSFGKASDSMINSDAIIIITAHKEFDNLNLENITNSMNKPILVDCTGKINPMSATSKGIIFRGIGRGGYN